MGTKNYKILATGSPGGINGAIPLPTVPSAVHRASQSLYGTDVVQSRCLTETLSASVGFFQFYGKVTYYWKSVDKNISLTLENFIIAKFA